MHDTLGDVFAHPVQLLGLPLAADGEGVLLDRLHGILESRLVPGGDMWSLVDALEVVEGGLVLGTETAVSP